MKKLCDCLWLRMIIIKSDTIEICHCIASFKVAIFLSQFLILYSKKNVSHICIDFIMSLLATLEKLFDDFIDFKSTHSYNAEDL